MTDDVLPWERPRDSAPTGVGICLSGGGLRAAAFALGVLQELDAARGVLCGPHAADYLSAVSGGSYTAAAAVSNCAERAAQPQGYPTRPLSPGSPEAEHIVGSARYLAGWRKVPFVGYLLLNILSVVVLYVWMGTMVVDYAIVSTLAQEAVPPLADLHSVLMGLDGFAGTIGLLVLLALTITVVGVGVFSENTLRRIVLSVLGFAALMVTTLPAVAALETMYWPAGNGSWFLLAAIVFGAAILLAGIGVGGAKLGLGRWYAVAAEWLAVWLMRGLGLVLLLWASDALYPRLKIIGADGEQPTAEVLAALVLFFGVLIGGALFSHLPRRASLHRRYRAAIASCFDIVRGDGDRARSGNDRPLSTLAPPVDPELRYPRLLVCATANGRAGRTRPTRLFAPLVFSHDVCGVPGHPGAVLPTAKLELGCEPASLVGWAREPTVSLFTAVASTGAAVSPSMGRFTVPSIRPVIAVAGVRLGRWLPNPFSVRSRRLVDRMAKPGRIDRTTALGSGYDDLVSEIFGSSGPRIYVSDGGHHDNLGLLALLRAGCARIWCVDSSPDTTGNASELRRVLELAEVELGVRHTVDLDRFGVGADGRYPTTAITGTLSYPDGSTAVITIVKLGLTAQTDSALLDYARQDRGFPHHKTIKQVYSAERMRAYCDLGRSSAATALTHQPAQVDPQPV